MTDATWPERERRAPDAWRESVDRRLASHDANLARILAIVERLDRDNITEAAAKEARAALVAERRRFWGDIARVIGVFSAVVGIVGGVVAIVLGLA